MTARAASAKIKRGATRGTKGGSPAVPGGARAGAKWVVASARVLAELIVTLKTGARAAALAAPFSEAAPPAGGRAAGCGQPQDV